MKSSLLVLLIGFLLPCSAQTSVSTVYVTNYVPDESLRKVDGKLYNVKRSVLWKPLEGECTDVVNNGVVVQQFEYEVNRVYAPVNYRRDIFGAPSGPRRMVTSETTTKIPTKKVFLRNYTNMQAVAVGTEISAHAMRVGTIDVKGKRLECWDCGTRVVVPVIKVAKDPQAKQATADAVLKLDQEKAAEGSALYQYRLGKRYLTGNGVEMDQAKARELFEKAAAQGSDEATAELKKLPPQRAPRTSQDREVSPASQPGSSRSTP